MALKVLWPTLLGDGASSSAASTGIQNDHAVSALADHHQLRFCELCQEESATVYCAADDAKLCWGCDLRIHSANFLVARHSRILLCPFCGSNCTSSAADPGAYVCHVCYYYYGGQTDSVEESNVQRQDGSHSSEDDEQTSSYDGQLRWCCTQKQVAGGYGSSCSDRDAGERRRWGSIACLMSSGGFLQPAEEGMGDSQPEIC